MALERLTGQGLGALLRSEVTAPLALTSEELSFGPRADLACVAPTEGLRRKEAELRGAPVSEQERPPLRGEVHDGNAAYLGGEAGNAGLFGTARAVFRVASALVAEPGFLEPAVRARILHQRPSMTSERRTLGFQHGSAATAPAGALGADSLGHVGYTGCSVWAGFEPPLVAVLLSNRVHPVDREVPMASARERFHSLAHSLVSEDA